MRSESTHKILCKIQFILVVLENCLENHVAHDEIKHFAFKFPKKAFKRYLKL